MKQAQQNSPWTWIPTLYFGQALPYVVVMLLSVVMYKNTGVSNTDIALYTSWLYLPWVIKPLWSPFVELFRTKRLWIVALQLLIGASLALVALTLPLPNYFQISLAVLWLMAFSSATHDIAADGFYMLGLEEHQQAAFVGVRSTFYRLAMIAGQGGLVYLAGSLAKSTGDVRLAWSVVFFLLAGLFVGLALFHHVMLPKPAADVPAARSGELLQEFVATFRAFFKRDGIAVILGFLLLFRLGEAQLLKLAVPFLLDPADKGGLGLSTEQVGLVYGTIGIIALTLGGLLGGYTISRFGLKRCLWPMVLAVHVPDLVFVYLATALPSNIYLIAFGIAAEQFGYGFGFASYMLYMIMVADGPHKTAHYAICTGFMALGMMLPGMVSGWIQQQLGYQHFFIYVCIATIPAFVMAAKVSIDPHFGKK
ncbi:MFS transporter, PAT family, beta-lactamase induction signal transducer AmpG [Janthinobacterium sp. CG_23.3]|uniref:MFS transporter n=1 Tax=unclassified Janthinobacterium TaxID=2610881 RepID=UPI0003478F48|nr:MFS transporter [Janthinobacterium sp. CG3]